MALRDGQKGKEDLLMLAHLRSNSKITLTDLSKKMNIPISTLFDRLRSHEQDIIVKHTSLFDFGKLGFSTKANILVRSGMTAGMTSEITC